MKILLLGEFSGVHLNLAKGLKHLGHEVVFAADGDGYRNFKTDISINTNALNLGTLVKDFMHPITEIEKFKGYDVVQLISPFIFNKKIPFYNNIFLKHLKKHNKKIFLISAGCGYKYKEGNLELTYSPCSDCLKIDKSKSGCPYTKPYTKYTATEVENFVDGIIPLAYEYHYAYLNNPKNRPIISYPIDTEKLKYEENKTTNNVITFFHGLNNNRSGFKGTHIIKKAMEIVKEKYPSDVDVAFAGNLSFDDYTKLLKRTNVVIDQSNSYCLAMNALNSMAMGKVVMGGAEPVAYEYLGNNIKIPALNILPDVKNIVNKMTEIIDRKSEITSIGLASRKFVEEYFDFIKVAQNFINTWEQKEV
jgi:glycosyltransferase involved in cell wall biosynthesis